MCKVFALGPIELHVLWALFYQVVIAYHSSLAHLPRNKRREDSAKKYNFVHLEHSLSLSIKCITYFHLLKSELILLLEKVANFCFLCCYSDKDAIVFAQWYRNSSLNTHKNVVSGNKVLNY